MSLSSRRAWIEIDDKTEEYSNTVCRSPHGERGLKCRKFFVARLFTLGRSPHGERGLKLLGKKSAILSHLSLSSRRAWIEIVNLIILS